MTLKGHLYYTKEKKEILKANLKFPFRVKCVGHQEIVQEKIYDQWGKGHWAFYGYLENVLQEEID